MEWLSSLLPASAATPRRLFCCLRTDFDSSSLLGPEQPNCYWVTLVSRVGIDLDFCCIVRYIQTFLIGMTVSPVGIDLDVFGNVGVSLRGHPGAPPSRLWFVASRRYKRRRHPVQLRKPIPDFWFSSQAAASHPSRHWLVAKSP